ncbi:MAG: DUF3037 domain-containing protein [Verrucomicrobiota bacterium]
MSGNPGVVCNYAVLRFLPYPETGEFVNLGIVVHCPEKGWLDLKLENRKSKRVTDFFPELDRAAFRSMRDSVAGELDRVKKLITGTRDRELGRRIFMDAVKPRESIFRFGEIRTIMTTEVERLVESLFGQYISRNFAQPKEYQENVMARKFFLALQNFRPDRHFRRDVKLGNHAYHVKVPICSEWVDKAGIPRRALKPLYLDRGDPTEIIDHGNAWVGRIEGLAEIGEIPDRFIFAVDLPESGDDNISAAAKIVDKLKGAGATVVRAQEMQKVLELSVD